MNIAFNRRAVLAAGASFLLPATREARAAVSSTVIASTPNLSAYRSVWSDNFKSLSLRSGGPTPAGYQSGRGTWTPTHPWNWNPRGTDGYGYDWFVNPSYAWPASYRATHPTGQFSIVPTGLRLRAEAPSPEMTSIIGYSPLGKPIWLSGILDSFHAVNIRAPFYFEIVAKGTPATGWPAAWLTQYPNPSVGISLEIDVFEEFGITNFLQPVMHRWALPKGGAVGTQSVIGSKTFSDVDLSAHFNVWGCWVMPNKVTVYFNDMLLGQAGIPAGVNMNNPFGIILNVSAGVPFAKLAPANGPLDYIVNRVTLYAPNSSGLTLG